MQHVHRKSISEHYAYDSNVVVINIHGAERIKSFEMRNIN